MRPGGRPQRAAHRHGRGTRYTVGPAAVVDPYPAAGLCAVYVPSGSATAIYYCEPTTGRCSCGAPAGSCPHIATITAALIRPQRSR